MDRHELAWAAGSFDGEGWAGKNQTRGVQARINQADGAAAYLLFSYVCSALSDESGPSTDR